MCSFPNLQTTAWLIPSNPLGDRSPTEKVRERLPRSKTNVSIIICSLGMRGGGEKQHLFGVFVSYSVPASCFQLNPVLLILLVISVLYL